MHQGRFWLRLAPLVLVVVTALALLPAPPCDAGPTTWRIEDVDRPRSYGFAPMRLDGTDQPLFVYGSGSLYVAWPTGADTWWVETVVEDCIKATALAIDASGEPMLAYITTADRGLWFASHASGAWSFELLDTDRGLGTVRWAGRCHRP